MTSQPHAPAGAVTIHGTAFHTPSRSQLEVLEHCLIEVDADGVITDVVASDDPTHAERKKAAEDVGWLVCLGGDEFLLPGFVDLHVHAPQWPQLGKALDVPLEVWLQKCTFPLEARFADPSFARGVYAHSWKTCSPTARQRRSICQHPQRGERDPSRGVPAPGPMLGLLGTRAPRPPSAIPRPSFTRCGLCRATTRWCIRW